MSGNQNSTMKTAIPTHRDPVLPQKQHGVLAFERSEDFASMFIEEIKKINHPSFKFIPHRQQINMIKLEKAKHKNFED